MTILDPPWPEADAVAWSIALAYGIFPARPSLGEANNTFAEKLPHLLELRPLLICPVCSQPPLHLLNYVRCLHSHGKTFAQIADYLEKGK